MSEQVDLSFLFNNAGDVVVEFPDEKLRVSLLVTCVGTNLYRLDAVPYLSRNRGIRGLRRGPARRARRPAFSFGSHSLRGGAPTVSSWHGRQ
jgi:hypothetical protein